MKTRICVIAALSLTAAACGSSSSNSSKAAPSAASTHRVVAVTNACSLMTPEQVTAATGVTVTQSSVPTDKNEAVIPDFGGKVCEYTNKIGLNAADIEVYGPDGYQRRINGLGSGDKATPLTGIGDKAYYDGRNVVVAVNGHTVMAFASDENDSKQDEQHSVALAKAVIAKLQ